MPIRSSRSSNVQVYCITETQHAQPLTAFAVAVPVTSKFTVLLKLEINLHRVLHSRSSNVQVYCITETNTKPPNFGGFFLVPVTSKFTVLLKRKRPLTKLENDAEFQ